MSMIRQLLKVQPLQLGSQLFCKRYCSTALTPISEIVEKRNYIFSQEQKRQLEEVGRVEQISVEVSGPPEDVVLMMNKNVSTPYECCKHISQPLCERSPLALIDDKLLWDMHRPLPGNCKLKFLSFRDKNPFSLNEAFWRTGSFLLGAVVMKAFKQDVAVRLHSFPVCKVNTGSFIYDVELKIDWWIPTSDELKVLSAEFLTLVFEKHKIERLSVKKSLALQLFEDNPYKLRDISQSAASSGDNLVTLYRVGDHIDVCNGPLVGDTSFFGRASVASVHQIECGDVQYYRFQGVALPKGIMLNSFAFDVLTNRGQTLNEIPLPDVPDVFQAYTETSIKNSNTPVSPYLNDSKF